LAPRDLAALRSTGSNARKLDTAPPKYTTRRRAFTRRLVVSLRSRDQPTANFMAAPAASIALP